MTQSNITLLIVEDDDDIAEILCAYAKREKMQTYRAIDGNEALTQLQRLSIDLVLLDVKLPEKDGWAVLSQLRQFSNVPVIMLTALDKDIDKIMALRMGADDYIVKPFNPNEVIARIHAVMRRSTVLSQINNNTENKTNIQFGNITLDETNHSVTIKNTSETENTTYELNLTLTEYLFLQLLIQTPNKVFTRSEILDRCLPESDALERTVDSHMSKLRKKISALPATATITSVRGVGYRLEKIA